MRILHINSYFNGCPFYKNLYNEQQKLGEDISVFMPTWKGDPAINQDYGDYTLVSPDHGRFDRLWFPLKQSKILADVERQYTIKDFDLIHAHSLFTNGYAAMMLKKRYGVPYVVAVRNTDVNVFFKKMVHLRKLGREILQNASKVIFMSLPYREQGIAPYIPMNELTCLREKSVIIPNGIDNFWLTNIPSRQHVPDPDLIRLLLVGRANKGKNIITALKSANILIARGHNVRFDVVIGRIEDDRIMRQIKSYPFVTVHERLTKEQLLPLYRECDIFLMPSLSETFGLVYAEAMSQGLPVIYTKGQGFDGQFQEGEVGYAVDPKKPAEIAARVEQILSRYDEISKTCLFECKRYDWALFANQYDEIYREVIEGGRS